MHFIYNYPFSVHMDSFFIMDMFMVIYGHHCLYILSLFQGGRFPIKWMAIESLLDGVSTTSSDA